MTSAVCPIAETETYGTHIALHACVVTEQTRTYSLFFLLEVYTTPTVRRIDIRAQQEQQKKSPNMAEDMFM